MKYFHKQRLLKLCDFLEQLPRTHFDFSVVAKKSGKHQCGTVGCAIGWTPQVFPRLMKWLPLRKGDGDQLRIAPKDAQREHQYETIARSLFGLSRDHSHDLFTPLSSVYVDRGDQSIVLESLDFDATPKQVAKRLRRFLKVMEKAAR